MFRRSIPFVRILTPTVLLLLLLVLLQFHPIYSFPIIPLFNGFKYRNQLQQHQQQQQQQRTLSLILFSTPPPPSSSSSQSLSLSLSNTNSNSLVSDRMVTTRNVATQILRGTGPVSDQQLDQYNIPYEQIISEWIMEQVTKVTESNNNIRVRLGCRNITNLYVDTVQITLQPKGGDGRSLGLVLTELAGGRTDGLGITIVSDYVPNGAADIAAQQSGTGTGTYVQRGDAIQSISLVRRKRQSSTNQQLTNNEATTTTKPVSIISETDEVYTVSTACLGYDATIEALRPILLLLPNDDNYDEYYIITIQRIRRKPKVIVKLQYPPDVVIASSTSTASTKLPESIIELTAGENLRQGLLVRGISLNDPNAKRFDTKFTGNCGAGGLCRTCTVAIIRGTDLLNPPRVAEKQIMVQGTTNNPRWRLACKAIVGYGMKEGEIVIRAYPQQWKS